MKQHNKLALHLCINSLFRLVHQSKKDFKISGVYTVFTYLLHEIFLVRSNTCCILPFWGFIH
jgi:hypothetical protein